MGHTKVTDGPKWYYFWKFKMKAVEFLELIFGHISVNNAWNLVCEKNIGHTWVIRRPKHFSKFKMAATAILKITKMVYLGQYWLSLLTYNCKKTV